MKDWSRIISATHESLAVFIKENYGFILGTFLGCELVDAYIVWVSSMLGEGHELAIPLALCRFTLALVEVAVLTLLVPLRLEERRLQRPRQSFWHYAAKYAIPLTLENLRAFGFTLLWSLLFLIPGIVKYLQYQFVSFVVLCDPAYEAGKVDALERSRELTKGIKWALLFIFIAVGVLSWGVGYLEESHPLYMNPVIWLFSFTGMAFINIYVSILLFFIYRVRMDGLPPET